VQAALHQDLIATKLGGFADFLQELAAIEDIAFGVFGRAIEGAEVADRRADVRVVDVAVDVVRAIRLRVQPARSCVGGAADSGQVVRF